MHVTLPRQVATNPVAIHQVATQAGSHQITSAIRGQRNNLISPILNLLWSKTFRLAPRCTAIAMLPCLPNLETNRHPWLRTADSIALIPALRDQLTFRRTYSSSSSTSPMYWMTNSPASKSFLANSPKPFAPARLYIRPQRQHTRLVSCRPAQDRISLTSTFNAPAEVDSKCQIMTPHLVNVRILTLREHLVVTFIAAGAITLQFRQSTICQT